MNVVEAAVRLSEKYQAVSHPYRTLILAHLIEKNEATWSDLKRFLELYFGTVNPNTLHFHLKVLIEMKWVTRLGSDEKSVYKLSKVPPDIADKITKEIAQRLEKQESSQEKVIQT